MKIFFACSISRLLCAALIVLTAFGAAGCASSPSTARRSNDGRTHRDENFAGQQRTTVSTGSNLVQPTTVSGNQADTASPTSVYGQGDLQRTGTSDVGGSLRRLDPSIH